MYLRKEGNYQLAKVLGNFEFRLRLWGHASDPNEGVVEQHFLLQELSGKAM